MYFHFIIAFFVFVFVLLLEIFTRKVSAATLFWAFFHAAIAATITAVAAEFVFELVANFLIKDLRV